MGCVHSRGERVLRSDSRIIVSPLIAASSPWVPPHGSTVNIGNAIEFLRKRGVYSADTAQQVKLFGYLRNPKLAPAAEVPYYTQCRATLMSLYKLVVNGETRIECAPSGSTLRMEQFPGFELPAPYTVASMVQRVQESKRCAPNAVALVQVGSINRSLLLGGLPPTHNMVDVADYWQHHATVERIQNQVFGLSFPEGSDTLLRSFLQPSSIVEAASLDQCEHQLALYGFGLISHFKVFGDLHDAGNDIIHFAGEPQGDCVNKPREAGRDPEYRL